MPGFTKLFSTIVSSTIWGEPDHVRIVWITMLALADQYGRVHASVPGLAHQARVSLDQARAALVVFESPDPDSRTPDHDGRRIAKIDGGWKLLNHGKHRDMQDDEAQKERKARNAKQYRDRHRVASPIVTGVTDRHRASPQADADADADTEKEAKASFAPSDKSHVAKAPPIGTLPCVGTKKPWPLYQAKVDEWQQTYPGISVLVELRKARQWLIDNPAKQKTFTGMPRYLNAWLAKAQNETGGRNAEHSKPARGNVERVANSKTAWNSAFDDEEGGEKAASTAFDPDERSVSPPGGIAGHGKDMAPSFRGPIQGVRA